MAKVLFQKSFLWAISFISGVTLRAQWCHPRLRYAKFVSPGSEIRRSAAPNLRGEGDKCQNRKNVQGRAKFQSWDTVEKSSTSTRILVQEFKKTIAEIALISNSSSFHQATSPPRILVSHIQCSCSGWPTGYGKKLSRSQAQLSQATWLTVA